MAGPLPKRVGGEAGARWAATAAFLTCTAALMWTLGVSFSPTAGLAVGAAVFGLSAALLWGRYLEDVRDERTRASIGGARVPFQAEVDDEEPPAAAPAVSQPARTASYYDDEDD